MEYNYDISATFRDDNYTRYVGWQESNDSIKEYFSYKTVKIISYKLTELLYGVLNKKIIIPERNICAMLGTIYDSYRPQTGDIYGRYNIPGDNTNCVQEMISQVIEVIFTDVRNNIEMAENNSKLNIWDATLMGDFNRKGLRQHAPIKIREKTPDFMGKVSFMSY